MIKVGRGEVTSGKGCWGTISVVESVQDVLQLMKMDLSNTIIFTSSASATTITPIFPKIKGVICTSGGATSHLAIVAREFDLPCLMGSRIEYNSGLQGRNVSFNADGEIFICNDG